MNFLDKLFNKKDDRVVALPTPPLFHSEPNLTSEKEFAYGPGDRIADRYEVVKTASGGMGVVYFCADQERQQLPLALKTFKPEFLSSRKVRDHFLREGTIWVGLSHPNIVQAYGVERIGDGREIYLALEWVAAGEDKEDASLRAWMETEGILSVEQALLFALHIARGMRYATTTIPGLVHRDLKPENVLVGRDDIARVTDFGLARILAGLNRDSIKTDVTSTDFRQTVFTQGLVGTPLYMAPEQWTREARVDVRTDIYAFGCILYELVAGQPAFMGDSLQKLAQAHRFGMFGKLPDHLPIEVRALIQRCMAIRPADRCQTWQEVEAASWHIFERLIGKPPPAQKLGHDQAGSESARAEEVAKGWSYNAMGLSYYDIGNFDLAAGYFERVVWIGRHQKDPILEATGLSYLGNACRAISDLDGATSYHKRQLRIAREVGDRSHEGDALGNLGNDYASMADVSRAMVYYQQQLGIAREVDDPVRQERALRNLGDANRELGRADKAIQVYKYALELATQNQNRTNQGRILSNIGIAYANLQDIEGSLKFYERAMDIAREIGDRAGEGIALGNMGLAYRDLGDTEKAVVLLFKYLKITREAHLRVEEGQALAHLGQIYLEADDPEQALQFYKDGLTIARHGSNKSWLADALLNVGTCYHKLDRLDQAIGYYEEYLTVASDFKSQMKTFSALHSLGNAYRDSGDATRATQQYEQSLKIAAALKDQQRIAKISLDFGILLARQGYRDKALRYADDAMKIFKEHGNKEAVKQAKDMISLIKRQKRIF